MDRPFRAGVLTLMVYFVISNFLYAEEKGEEKLELEVAVEGRHIDIGFDELVTLIKGAPNELQERLIRRIIEGADHPVKREKPDVKLMAIESVAPWKMHLEVEQSMSNRTALLHLVQQVEFKAEEIILTAYLVEGGKTSESVKHFRTEIVLRAGEAGRTLVNAERSMHVHVTAKNAKLLGGMKSLRKATAESMLKNSTERLLGSTKASLEKFLLEQTALVTD